MEDQENHDACNPKLESHGPSAAAAFYAILFPLAVFLLDVAH